MDALARVGEPGLDLLREGDPAVGTPHLEALGPAERIGEDPGKSGLRLAKGQVLLDDGGLPADLGEAAQEATGPVGDPLDDHPPVPAVPEVRVGREASDVLEGPVVLVDPKVIRRLVVGDIDVHPAIAVEIRAHNTESVAHRSADPGFLRDVHEVPMAIVVIKLGGK